MTLRRILELEARESEDLQSKYEDCVVIYDPESFTYQHFLCLHTASKQRVDEYLRQMAKRKRSQVPEK